MVGEQALFISNMVSMLKEKKDVGERLRSLSCFCDGSVGYGKRGSQDANYTRLS